MNCEMSMYDFVKKSILDKTKEKIIYFNNRINGYDLFSQIDAVAIYLTKLGVKKGDAVGICLPNIPQAVISFYATNKIGAIANILHPKISLGALMKIIEKTNTRTLFVFDSSLEIYKTKLLEKGINIISCSASLYLKGIKKQIKRILEPKYGEGIIDFSIMLEEKGEINCESDCYATSVYLHSGGTTGEPKTVMLSSFAFNKLVDNVIISTSKNHKYTVDHSMLMVLPLFHGFGLGICIHLSLANFKVVMMPKFSTKESIKLIRKHKIDYIAGIPTMYNKLLSDKNFDGKYLSSLKLLFCGADTLSQKTKNEFDEILLKNNSSAEIYEGYGLSEVASVLTVNVKGETKKGTQGKPINEAKVLILDDKGSQCPPLVAGEVVIQSQAMMNGYFGEENHDHYYFMNEKGEKWLRTGDIGFVDEDGYFTFKGREKRIIKIAGVNIFPSEIETLVMEMKEIDNACIARTTIDNKSALKLIIQMNKSFRYSTHIEKLIKDRIAEEFMSYAIPRKIIVVDKIELTLMNKVDYKKYEDMSN